MVMTIRNTCRMFDDLFQLAGNREMKSLNFSNISVGGLEPVSVVYIEVYNIENFSVWVFSQLYIQFSLLSRLVVGGGRL